MPDPETPPVPAGPATDDTGRKRRLDAKRRNEHLKLAAGAFDRLSTVVLGGAVLAPIFQHRPAGWWETAGWLLGAGVLHGAAQYLISLLQEEG